MTTLSNPKTSFTRPDKGVAESAQSSMTRSHLLILGAYVEEAEPNSKIRARLECITAAFDLSRYQMAQAKVIARSSSGSVSPHACRIASCRSFALFSTALIPRHNGCTGNLTSAPYHTILLPGHLTPQSVEEPKRHVACTRISSPVLPNSLAQCLHTGLRPASRPPRPSRPHRPRLPPPLLWHQSPPQRRRISHSSSRFPITSAPTQNS